MILLSFFIRNAYSVHFYVRLCLIEKKLFYATCELFEQIKKYFCEGLHLTLALLSSIFIPVSDTSFLCLVYDMTQKYSWVSLVESFAMPDYLLKNICHWRTFEMHFYPSKLHAIARWWYEYEFFSHFFKASLPLFFISDMCLIDISCIDWFMYVCT